MRIIMFCLRLLTFIALLNSLIIPLSVAADYEAGAALPRGDSARAGGSCAASAIDELSSLFTDDTRSIVSSSFSIRGGADVPRLTAGMKLKDVVNMYNSLRRKYLGLVRELDGVKATHEGLITSQLHELSTVEGIVGDTEEGLSSQAILELRVARLISAYGELKATEAAVREAKDRLESQLAANRLEKTGLEHEKARLEREKAALETELGQVRVRMSPDTPLLGAGTGAEDEEPKSCCSSCCIQ